MEGTRRQRYMCDWRKNNRSRLRVHDKARRSSSSAKLHASVTFRAWHLKKFGLTAEGYAELLLRQGGGCAICKSTTPAGRGRFHVDHDHACCPGPGSCGKCVRGLLCHHCNLGLGNFKDDPLRLKLAASYLGHADD